MVKPGGVLVYAVCSLQPEEGPMRIDAALHSPHGADFARVSLDAAAGNGLPVAMTANGDLRSLPCDLAALGGLDGFYVAALKRRG